MTPFSPALEEFLQSANKFDKTGYPNWPMSIRAKEVVDLMVTIQNMDAQITSLQQSVQILMGDRI